MRNKIWKIIVLIILLVVVSLLCCDELATNAKGEEWTEQLIVTANHLNGRSAPGKKNRIEAMFDEGDILEATGNWNKNYTWVEVKGGEDGTVWCDIRYVNALSEPVTMTYEGKGKVKIRKSPVDGTVIGYLKSGKEVEITQVVLGWGKCKKGWIDIGYLTEE